MTWHLGIFSFLSLVNTELNWPLRISAFSLLSLQRSPCFFSGATPLASVLSSFNNGGLFS